MILTLFVLAPRAYLLERAWAGKWRLRLKENTTILITLVKRYILFFIVLLWCSITSNIILTNVILYSNRLVRSGENNETESSGMSLKFLDHGCSTKYLLQSNTSESDKIKGNRIDFVDDRLHKYGIKMKKRKSRCLKLRQHFILVRLHYYRVHAFRHISMRPKNHSIINIK